MEIIKDLPEVFEEFAEQRQKSFLAVKQLKDKGIPVIDPTVLIFQRRSPWQWALQQSASALHLMRRSQQQKRICHVTYAH